MKNINEKMLTEEECFEQNEKLIHYCIKPYLFAIEQSAIDYDDLFSEGCIGMMKAYRNFDDTRGLQFSTYASHKIRGQIRNFLREFVNPVKYPRSIKDRALSKDSQDHDSINYRQNVMYFSQPIAQNEGQTLYIEDTLEHEDDYTHIYLNDYIRQQDERMQTILTMTLDGHTQTEIAKVVGVSQVQVSRLLKEVG